MLEQKVKYKYQKRDKKASDLYKKNTQIRYSKFPHCAHNRT